MSPQVQDARLRHPAQPKAAARRGAKVDLKLPSCQRWERQQLSQVCKTRSYCARCNAGRCAPAVLTDRLQSVPSDRLCQSAMCICFGHGHRHHAIAALALEMQLQELRSLQA